MLAICRVYFPSRKRILINTKSFSGGMEDFKATNQKQRDEFIDFWVNYIKTHPDEEWSRQQNVLINSGLKIAKLSEKEL